MGQGQDRAHHVLDDEQAHPALVNAADQPDDGLDLGRVQPRHDLVEQQQPGAGGESAGHLQALAVGEREVAGGHVATRSEPDEVHDLRGLPPGRPDVARPVEGAHHHVLERGEPGEGLHELERPREAQAADRVGLEPDQGRVVEGDRAVARRVEAGDQVEHGGLAGAVGPDEPDDLAGRDREVEPVDGLQPAEALAEPADLQTRGHAAAPRRAAAPEPAHEPVRQERDDQDQDQPVEHDVGARPAAQHRARDLGDRREHERAEERAGHRARPAHDRGQEAPDGDRRPEGQARVDVGEVLRVEGPAQRGEEGRHRHRGELGRERVHPGCLRRVLVLADRGQRVAHARALDRPADQERAQHHREDHVVVRQLAPRRGTASAPSPGSAPRGRARSPTAFQFTATTRSISAKARVTSEKYGPRSP